MQTTITKELVKEQKKKQQIEDKMEKDMEGAMTEGMTEETKEEMIEGLIIGGNNGRKIQKKGHNAGDIKRTINFDLFNDYGFIFCQK